jgi:hypothetical protein
MKAEHHHTPMLSSLQTLQTITQQMKTIGCINKTLRDLLPWVSSITGSRFPGLAYYHLSSKAHQ